MRVILIMLACALTCFGAGYSVDRLLHPAPPPPQDHYMAELNLSPEQREKIKAIWTDVSKNSGPAQREKREAAQKEFIEALQTLATPEQKPKLDVLVAEYRKKLDQISQDARKLRDEAIERTKAELNDEQRAAYDEIRKKRQEERTHESKTETPTLK